MCVLFWGTRVLHTNTVTLYTCYKIIIAIRCFKTKMIWHLNHLIYTAREVLSIDCQLLSLWATTVEQCVVHKRVGSKSRFFVENEKSDFRWESRIFSCCCSCRQGRWARYILYTPKTASVVVQSSTKRQREKEANLAGFQWYWRQWKYPLEQGQQKTCTDTEDSLPSPLHPLMLEKCPVLIQVCQHPLT